MSYAQKWIVGLLVLVAVTCGGATKATRNLPSVDSQSSSAISSGVRNGLADDFRVIPADATYVFVSFDPRAGLIPGLVRFATPIFEAVAKEESEDANADELRRIQIFRELLGPNGMEKVGIDSTPNFAIYSIGTAFVARIELSDGAALEAFVTKTANDAGDSIQFTSEGEWRTWQSHDDELTFLVAIRDSELVFSIMQSSDKDGVLPMLIGGVLPKRSLVDTGLLKELGDRYPGQSIGYLDNDQLYGHLADGAFDSSIAKMSETCLKETRSLFGIVPRVVMSIEQSGQDEFTYHMGVELRRDIALQFRRAVGPIPAYELVSRDKSSMSFGVGLKVDKIITWWRKIAHGLSQSPYQCKEFEELNKVSESAAMLASIPPLFGEITGIVFSIEEMKADSPESIVAVAAVESWNPKALLSFVFGMFPVPGFSSQNVQDDGIAVELPLKGMGLPQGMYLAMGPRMLGLGVGESGPILRDLMSAEVSTGGPFIAAHYDYSKWQHLIDDNDDDLSPEMRTTVNSLLASLGQVGFTMDATEFGVHMMTTVELK